MPIDRLMSEVGLGDNGKEHSNPLLLLLLFCLQSGLLCQLWVYIWLQSMLQGQL